MLRGNSGIVGPQHAPIFTQSGKIHIVASIIIVIVKIFSLDLDLDKV